MSILDKKGIGVTSGFKLVSGAPIDARFTAEDEIDLQSLIDNGAVYNGLEVWVNSLGKKKMYNGTEFVDVATGGSGGTGKVFEDVTEIPSTPDSNVIYRISSVGGGTVVPNTGLVDKVYFNTSLPTEEVVELIKNSGITFFDPINQVPSTEQGMYIVYEAVDSKGSMGNGMQLMYGEPLIADMFGAPARLAILASVYPKDENGDYTNEETMIPIFVSEDVPSMGLSAGWQGLDSIEIGGTLVNDADWISVGSENDKLTSLFSLTSDFSIFRYINVVDGKEFEFASTNSIKDDTYYIDITYNQDNSGANFKAELEKIQIPLDLSEDLIKNGKIVIRVKEIGINLIAGGEYNHYTYYRLTDGKKVPLGGSDESGQPYVFISLSFGNTDRNHSLVQAEAHTINLQTTYTSEDGLVISNNFYQQGVSSSSVTVDGAMSDTSANPVQNKVIKDYVDNAIASAIGAKLMEEY